jgi:D-tyrosyl-tRNA(Tyr) deacylase
MRVIVQRVSEAGVYIPDQKYQQEIKKGMLIFLGVKQDDDENDIIFLADKCSNLRIFEDDNSKMNLSLKDVKGETLIISQFTLYGDAQKGNRPSFIQAARPEIAISLYAKFIDRMKNNLGGNKVKSGIFGAMMQVKIINDGPVTILIDSK